MERVALDVLGPLPTTGRGNRYTLAVSYYFTKWPEAFDRKSQDPHSGKEACRRVVDALCGDAELALIPGQRL